MIKKLAVLIFLIFLSSPAICGLKGDRWDGRDKALHLGFSFVGSTLLYCFFYDSNTWKKSTCSFAAGTTMLLIGATKELTDDDFSWKDMGANSVGVGLGITLSYQF